MRSIAAHGTGWRRSRLRALRTSGGADRDVGVVVGQQPDRLGADRGGEVGRVPDEGLAGAQVAAGALAGLLDDVALGDLVGALRAAAAAEVVERDRRTAVVVRRDP